MPTLKKLEAKFLRRDDDRTCTVVASLEEAHGITFLCPKCYKENGGREGTHQIRCWFKGKVPDDASPGPGRWNPSGTGLHDLSFIPPGNVSVLLMGGCGWHGFVAYGKAN